MPRAATMEMGPSVIVAKRGEYGAVLFTDDGSFAIPGLPLEEVRDPTGAGDSFAGGFLGYLDGVRVNGGPRRPGAAPGDGLRLGDGLVQRRGLRDRAASRTSTSAEIAERLAAFKRLTHFDADPA